MSSRRAETRALQRVLAAEHAVVYAYGVAGARLDGAQQQRARQEWDRHRARRDELERTVATRGDQPVPPAPAYALPDPVRIAPEATAALTLVEERLGAVWADAVASLTGDLRLLAARGLADAAVAAAEWRGGRSVPFPGLPER